MTFTFKLDRLDGTPADPPTFKTTDSSAAGPIPRRAAVFRWGRLGRSTPWTGSQAPKRPLDACNVRY
jgi:hypothetical protein